MRSQPTPIHAVTGRDTTPQTPEADKKTARQKPAKGNPTSQPYANAPTAPNQTTEATDDPEHPPQAPGKQPPHQP